MSEETLKEERTEEPAAAEETAMPEDPDTAADNAEAAADAAPDEATTEQAEEKQEASKEDGKKENAVFGSLRKKRKRSKLWKRSRRL